MQAFWSRRAPGRGRRAVVLYTAACTAALVSFAAACGDDDGDGTRAAASLPGADASTPTGVTGTVGPDAGAATPGVLPPSTNQQQPPATAQDAGTTPPATTQDAGTGGTGDTYFAEVTANGTGCPAGTWNAQLAADKQSFTITFSAYQAQVAPSDAASIKDCQLGLKLRSKKPVSYAVQEFAFDGYARLDPGVNAKLMATYYFQGNPVTNVDTRVDVNGPYDQAFSFRQSIGLPERVWSDCALERDLNVTTRVRVMNGSPGANGRVNITQGTGAPRLFVALSQRACP